MSSSRPSRSRPASPPPLPSHRVHQLAEEASPDAQRGFLKLRRVSLSVESPGGERSEPMTYDLVERRQMDAAVIVAHCQQDGALHVYLRSALRPPLALRPALAMSGVAWELPAGLIDEGETPPAAAARELGEELGFDRTAGDMRPLGPRTVPVPGAIAEVQYFFCVEVDPATQRAPAEDGILEREGAVVLVRLDDALGWVREGLLLDAKTELGLRRLEELMGLTKQTESSP